MTEWTNAELIDEIATAVEDYRRFLPEPYPMAPNPDLAVRVAAALEAAEQRAKRLNAEREQLHAAYVTQVKLSMNANDRAAGFERALDVADQRAAELAAVVEKVREADTVTSSWDHFGHLVMDILATTPADALREHDTALIEKLADEFAARLPDGTGNGRVYNSHTVARMLREKARQRREEQGR